MSDQKKYSIIDSHLHYLDFTQNTDGFPALAQAMDRAGVEKAVIFGMPMAKTWDHIMEEPPTYYLSNDSRCYYYSATDFLMAQDLIGQPEEIRSRFMPFCCGFNCNDRYASRQIERLLDLYPNFWRGIGEIMSRHDDLTALTYGEGLHMNSDAFCRIYDLAAERDLPVLVHHNIAAQNVKEPIYLKELERALAHNRKTRIIWAHIGISRRIEMEELLIIAGRLLHDNPNLWVDISWIVYDDYILGKNIDAAAADDLLDSWAILIEHYPDRFMIGSDKVGHWADYPHEILKYYKLLDRLKPETVEKICRKNILSLVKNY